MLRKKLLKLFIIVFCLTALYYYMGSKGYFKELDEFISTHFKSFLIVKRIEIRGNSLLSDDKILEICDIKESNELYQYSAQEIRNKLLAIKEIKDANVQINYSGIIRILIEEKKPFAIWWNDNIPLLIDEDGDEILKIKDVEEYHNLIIIFGANINKQLKSFLHIIKQYPLYQNIISMHYVGNRRWDIYLNNNIVVKLPEQNLVIALARAEKVLKSLKYKDKIDILDLRLYPKKTFLKLKTGYDKKKEFDYSS